MSKNNICDTEFEGGQTYRELLRYIYPKHNMLEGKSTPNMINN